MQEWSCQASITVSADANTYAWNNGVSDGTAFTINGYYVVTSTTSSGCTSQDSLLVTIVPSKDASFGYNNANFCTTDTDPVVSMTVEHLAEPIVPHHLV